MAQIVTLDRTVRARRVAPRPGPGARAAGPAGDPHASFARAAHLAGRFQRATTVPAVFDALAEVLDELLGARLEQVQLAVDDRGSRPPWGPGTESPAGQPAGGTSTGSAPTPVSSTPASTTSASGALHLPLRVDDRVLGAVTVVPAPGRGPRKPSAADVDAAAAVVGLAAAAVARLAEEEGMRLRLHHAQALYRLSDVVAGTGGIAAALRELNRTLPEDLGITLRSVCLTNPQMRAAVGAEAPEGVELEAVRSWRAILAKGRTPLRPRPVPGGLLVPVAHRARVQGALRVRLRGTGPRSADRRTGDRAGQQGRRGRIGEVDDLLLALGAGCAEVVQRAALQRHLADSERRLAVAAERERIAQDLHDSVGQIVTGMGMRVAQYLADAPDRIWRARLEDLLRLAARGNREVREAIHALLFLDVHREGLRPSVRELVRKFEVTTGVPVRFQVRGTPVVLPSAKEDALFRVAHEALMNVERHSRAALVTVQLLYSADGVVLSVRDDGVGLGHRDPFGGDGGHFGIRAMQQRLEAAGGELRVQNARPRGVVVEARIARRRAGQRAGRQRADRADEGTGSRRPAARGTRSTRGAPGATGTRGGHR